jgi:hypothetical protein
VIGRQFELPGHDERGIPRRFAARGIQFDHQFTEGHHQSDLTRNGEPVTIAQPKMDGLSPFPLHLLGLVSEFGQSNREMRAQRITHGQHSDGNVISQSPVGG